MSDLLAALTTPALLALSVGAGLLVVVTDWRLSYVALLVVYAGMVTVQSPLLLAEVAGAKLVVGLMVVGILAITGAQLNFGQPAVAAAADPGPAHRRPFATPTNLPFRVAAALMVGAAAWYVATRSDFLLPGLDELPAVNTASFLLMGLGLLNLGLTEEPINAGMGLLVVVLGFELFYAAVEPSLAVMALLVAVEFGIALAASYLALIGHRPSTPAETA